LTKEGHDIGPPQRPWLTVAGTGRLSTTCKSESGVEQTLLVPREYSKDQSDIGKVRTEHLQKSSWKYYTCNTYLGTPYLGNIEGANGQGEELHISGTYLYRYLGDSTPYIAYQRLRAQVSSLKPHATDSQPGLGQWKVRPRDKGQETRYEYNQCQTWTEYETLEHQHS